MDLQPAGAYSALPNPAQAQALDALGNIQGAVQGADGRVQQAYEKIIRHLQEAIKQSEANNQTIVEKNVQLTNENGLLKQQNKELTDNFAIQQQQHAASLKAEQDRTAALKANFNAECDQIISKAQNPTPPFFVDYGPLSPVSRREWQTFNDQRVSGLNQLAQHGKNIKAQVNNL